MYLERRAQGASEPRFSSDAAELGDRRIELAACLLDSDHGLVEPAAADLRQDDHERLRVSRESLASGRLPVERLADLGRHLAVGVEDGLVEASEGRVVLGIEVQPLGEGRHVDGAREVVAEAARLGDQAVGLGQPIEGFGVLRAPPEGRGLGGDLVVLAEQGRDPGGSQRPDSES